jgi:hypothetical protein
MKAPSKPGNKYARKLNLREPMAAGLQWASMREFLLECGGAPPLIV